MKRFNQDIQRTIKSMSKQEYQKLKSQSKQFSDPIADKYRSFRDDCVLFNHALPSLKQRTMLFEKIYFLIDVNRRRELRKRNNIDSFVSEMKYDTSNWELQKKIIDIIRHIYLKEYQEDMQKTEFQISILQKQ